MPTLENLVFTVAAHEDGLPLAAFLRRRGVSLRMVRSLKMVDDGLMVNGQAAKSNRPLHALDVVALGRPPRHTPSARPEATGLRLLYQSAEVLVVDKPAGMVVHPGPSHHGGTLANAVCGWMDAHGWPAAFYPVGRLDGDTSGLMVCALQSASVPLVAKTLEKTYIALVTGCPKALSGTIDAPLGPVPGSAIAQQVNPAGRPSRTDYSVLAAGAEASLVAVWPRTGRTHQIRAHFAHLGHPLLGDVLYGGDTALMRRQALHCAAVRFEELGGNAPRLRCAPPADMRLAARALGLTSSVTEEAMRRITTED